MFYSFNITGKYKLLLHISFSKGFFFSTFEVISLKDSVQILQFLKSKCTKHPPLSNCSTNRHLTFLRRKVTGNDNVHGAMTQCCLCVGVYLCNAWKHHAWDCHTMKRNDLCDIFSYIILHSYISYTSVRSYICVCFKALLATLYAGTKCAKTKYTHEHEFPLMLKPVA